MGGIAKVLRLGLADAHDLVRGPALRMGSEETYQPVVSRFGNIKDVRCSFRAKRKVAGDLVLRPDRSFYPNLASPSPSPPRALAITRVRAESRPRAMVACDSAACKLNDEQIAFFKLLAANW